MVDHVSHGPRFQIDLVDIVAFDLQGQISIFFKNGLSVRFQKPETETKYLPIHELWCCKDQREIVTEIAKKILKKNANNLLNRLTPKNTYQLIGPNVCVHVNRVDLKPWPS